MKLRKDFLLLIENLRAENYFEMKKERKLLQMKIPRMKMMDLILKMLVTHNYPEI